MINGKGCGETTTWGVAPRPHPNGESVAKGPESRGAAAGTARAGAGSMHPATRAAWARLRYAEGLDPRERIRLDRWKTLCEKVSEDCANRIEGPLVEEVETYILPSTMNTVTALQCLGLSTDLQDAVQDLESASVMVNGRVIASPMAPVAPGKWQCGNNIVCVRLDT